MEFEQFAHSCAPSLLRSAVLLTGDAHAAEDLVQEALTKIYVRWRRVGAMTDPVAYTRVAMTRTFLSQRRKRGGHEPPTAVVREPPTSYDDPAVRLSVAAALASLPPLDRAVLVLRFFEDRSAVQVADDLGLSPGAVRNRTMRALAALRPHLADLEETREP